MKFDLHMHSNASRDGEKTPAQLVAIAKEKGLKVIALADHDNVRNVRNIAEAAKKEDIQVICAIEVSTSYGPYSVHLLAYGIDLDDAWINSLEAGVDQRMAEAFDIRIDKIEKRYGIRFDREDIKRRAGNMNPWFTLIETMLAMPEVQDVAELQPYLPGGKRCTPAPVNYYWDLCQPGSDLFVEVRDVDLKEAIERVHAAGGIAVIAHPFNTFYRQEDRLQDVLDYGADGLEVYSNYHSPEQIAWYKDYAEKHGLLITCGSDYHGKIKPQIEMGDFHATEDTTRYLEALQQALAKENDSPEKDCRTRNNESLT